MAIITFGPMVSDARGSIGGVTLSANKSGPFAKQKGLPSNPRTNKQTQQRSNLAAMPNEWALLTTLQKGTWDTFAGLPAQELFNSLGVGFFASGFNWFTKTGVRLLRMERSILATTPTQARPAAPEIDVFFITSTGTSEIEYPEGEFEATPNYDLVLQIAKGRTTGVQVQYPNFLEVLLTKLPGLETQEFQSELESVFGTISAGTAFFAKVARQTTQGIRSSFSELRTISV